jgi:dihydropteroate synthase
MFTLNCKGRLLTATRPLVMGIINITPDSFYEASRYSGPENILQKVEQMLNEGATILDIGGQSTRPGSDLLSTEEELHRIIAPIATIAKQFPEAIMSVDPLYAKVAEEAVNTGASIINEISGGMMDAGMLSTAAALKVPYICMHMKGTPQTMQQHAVYDDIAREVLDHFIERTGACQRAGIYDVILDPGFGFAKTTKQNFKLLKELSVLQILDKPLLVGLSRKGSIYKTLGTTADKALNGTTVMNTIALQNGAQILRVHDVKEAAEAVMLFCAYNDL